MKILMVHNRFLVRGGEDESTDAEIALLREHGHDVDFFELDNRAIAGQSAVRTGLDAVWSSRVYRAVRSRIQRNGHDLVHVQNFFPLFSPAVHHAAKAENRPVIQALRNYRLFCLNALLFRDGQICEDCLGKPIPWPGVIHRCYRASLAGSIAEASMLTVHRALHTWEDRVDLYLAVSEFVRDKYMQGGFPSDRIMVKPNVVVPDPGLGDHQAEFVLFVGRLSSEKGLACLCEAWDGLKDLHLKIVGDGPLQDELQSRCSGNPAIELAGRLRQSEALELMKHAKILIMPSEWFEGFGRVIVEAFACGLPVIAANLGAMTNIVVENSTGLHFEAGNARDLTQKVRWLWDHPAVMAQMGLNARKEYESKYAAELNYDILLRAYRTAMDHARH